MASAELVSSPRLAPPAFLLLDHDSLYPLSLSLGPLDPPYVPAALPESTDP